MSDLPRVVLTTVYRWLCPECGWDNIEVPWPAELNIDERLEVQQITDQSVNAYNFVVAPEEVTCTQCGREYAVEEEE